MTLRRYFIIFSIIIVASLAIISYMRASIYHYDVALNYQFTFQNDYSKTTILELKNNRLLLPAKNSEEQTSFVKMDIETTLMGRFSQPSVEITDGKTSLRQYFEHGARGTRYINISQLLCDKGVEIKFTGSHASFDDQQIEFIQMENQPLANKRVLIFAAHPDDAEIAAFGLYNGHKDTYVVTVTAGEAGPANYDEIYQNKVAQFLKKGQVRTWNSLTVPMLGGILPERILNLGFFDGTLKKMADDPDLITEGLYTKTSDINIFRSQNTSSLAAHLTGTANWTSLVQNMATLLELIKPDIIVAPLPSLDSHPDHKYTFHALAEAIKLIGKKDGELYLYTNHLLYDFYPYGEMGSVISMPPRNSFYFSKIYSHPLSTADQQSKILALDAMNDLRPDTEYRFFDVSFGRAFSMMIDNLLGQNVDYFRRSVRSNELFFVIKTEEIYDDEKLDQLR